MLLGFAIINLSIGLTITLCGRRVQLRAPLLPATRFRLAGHHCAADAARPWGGVGAILLKIFDGEACMYYAYVIR